MIKIITQTEQLEALKPEIERLFSISDSSYLHYLHEPNVLSQHLTTAKSFVLLTVYQNNQLTALFPLIKQPGIKLMFSVMFKFNIPVPLYKLWGNYPLLDRDDNQQALGEFNQYLLTNRPSFGVAIDQLDHHSPLAEQAFDCGLSYTPCFSNDPACYRLHLPETLDEFVKSFSKKRRYNFNRSHRLLSEAEGGEVRLKEYQDSADLKEFWQHSDHVRSKSWQGKVLNTGPHMNESAIKTSLFLIEKKLFRSFILFKGNEPISFIRGYQLRNKYFYQEIGYMPEWKEYSPGTILNWLAFQEVFKNHPPRFVDFGLGEAQYKKTFGNDSYKASSGLLSRKMNLANAVAQFQLFIYMVETALRNLAIKLNIDKLLRKYLKKG